LEKIVWLKVALVCLFIDLKHDAAFEDNYLRVVGNRSLLI
jgi:hypothetical protein